MAIDKDALLKRDASTGHEPVEIPGVGAVVVRPLTRGEALEVQGKEMPVPEMERKLLAWAMVDPKLSEDEVRQWQDTSPAGEIEEITNAIIRISGMEKAANRAAYQQFRG